MSHPTDRALAVAGLLIAITAIVVSVAVPEVRRSLGLEGGGDPSAAALSPSAGATDDSTVAPAADTTGWRTTYADPTDVAVPAISSFAPAGPADTVAEVVNAPTWDTVVTITTTTTDTVYGTPR